MDNGTCRACQKGTYNEQQGNTTLGCANLLAGCCQCGEFQTTASEGSTVVLAACVCIHGHGVLPPFVQGTPHSEYGQLSPFAALCSSCFHSPHAPFYTVCTLPFSCSHTSASAVRKGMCQSLPGATFSAVAMVWTCFLAIFLSLLGLTLPGGGSPYFMYESLVSPFSSGLDLQSISCPTPFHL